MTIKNILSLTTLLGALATASVASAGHPHRDRDWTSAEERLDVIATARLVRGSGVAAFTITPGMRRDGLLLESNVPGLRVRSIDLIYSDGRVERLRGPNLRAAFFDAPLVTIQRGRPPGLRTVEVRYTLPARERFARLRLIQLHTGDGYTRDEDIYRGGRTFDSHDIEAPYRDGYDRTYRRDGWDDDDRYDDEYRYDGDDPRRVY